MFTNSRPAIRPTNQFYFTVYKISVSGATDCCSAIAEFDRMDDMNICQAITQEEIAQARCLFEEYAAWLNVDLCFQGFAFELAGLPGLYAAPRGRLLLALAGDEAAGCVALRPLDGDICEMKRLFVRPAFRGHGVGRILAERVIAEARSIGYSTMKLDTLPIMRAATYLYESLGFVCCPAYYDTPLKDTIFMELKL
jgi:putative acetyltransferase